MIEWPYLLQEWPEEVYPPYANGPGYVVSSDIARFIVKEFEQHTLRVRFHSSLDNAVALERTHRLHQRREFYTQSYLKCGIATKWLMMKLLTIALWHTCSCLRWRMWAWACGLSNSTPQHLLNISTTSNSASLDALRTTTRLTTSRRGRWCACGRSFAWEDHNAATWDNIMPV